jgi:hypothetical protein
MASINEEVAALLREYAELLGLTGGDPFRVRSYEKAAKAVAGYPDDLGTLPEKALTRVPGVGPSVAAKIAEYRRTGTIKAVDDLRAKVPPGALLLAKVPGVGPKRALQIAGDLGVTSVGELAEAVRSGRLRGVPGFGPKSEERILRGIGVAASDAALRGALRALPANATQDDIYAVLAAHVVTTSTSEERGSRAVASGTPTGATDAAEEAAALVRGKDLRGDLHTHTDLTDGIVSLEGMIAAAEARGYEYYAVTDHAPNLVMQRMTDEKMLAQRDQLRARGHHRHGPAARQRAQHRGGRLRGLGRGLPERIRPLRRLGPDGKPNSQNMQRFFSLLTVPHRSPSLKSPDPQTDLIERRGLLSLALVRRTGRGSAGERLPCEELLTLFLAL